LRSVLSKTVSNNKKQKLEKTLWGSKIKNALNRNNHSKTLKYHPFGLELQGDAKLVLTLLVVPESV